MQQENNNPSKDLTEKQMPVEQPEQELALEDLDQVAGGIRRAGRDRRRGT